MGTHLFGSPICISMSTVMSQMCHVVVSQLFLCSCIKPPKLNILVMVHWNDVTEIVEKHSSALKVRSVSHIGGVW